MNILLINPPRIKKVWAGIPRIFDRGVFLFPPLGLMYIESYLREKSSHTVRILDALAEDLSYGRLRKRLMRERFDMAGITCCTHNMADVSTIINMIREKGPKIHICLGGPHVRSYPEESIALPGVDYAVPGDGEIAFTELADCLDIKGDPGRVAGLLYKDRSGRIHRTAPRKEIRDLDSLPFPDRSNLSFKGYYTPATETDSVTTIISARGCPNNCIFCDTERKYRARSARNVVDEMEQAAGQGIKEFFFLDDTFNATSHRIDDVSREILKRDLRVKWGFKARCDNIDLETLKLAGRAGLTKIHYGVETGTDEGLEALNKKLDLFQIEQAFKMAKWAGIRTIAFFMIGCPHEKSAGDIDKTLRFMTRIRADYAVIAVYSPYPDTASYRDGVARKVFPDTPWKEFIKDPSSERADLPTCWEEHLSKKEIFRHLKRAHRKFYLRPGTVLNALFGMHGLAEAKRSVRGGLALIRLALMGDPGDRI